MRFSPVASHSATRILTSIKAFELAKAWDYSVRSRRTPHAILSEAERVYVEAPQHPALADPIQFGAPQWQELPQRTPISALSEHLRSFQARPPLHRCRGGRKDLAAASSSLCKRATGARGSFEK